MKYVFWFLVLSFGLLFAQEDYLRQARQLVEQHKFTEAARLLEPHANTAPALYQLSVIRLMQGELDKAIDLAERGLALTQNKDRFYEWLGDIYALKAQNSNIFKAMMMVSKIKTNWQKALECNPDNVNAREKLVTFYLMAPGIAGGDEEKALQLAKPFQTKNKARWHLLMARYYQKKKEIASAEQNYQQAYRLAPDSTKVLYEVALYYMGQKQFDKARPYIQRILTLKPEEESGYTLLGDFYLKQDQPDSALVQYQKALKRAPYQYKIKFKEARTLARLGRKEEARRLAKELLDAEIFFTMRKQVEDFLDTL